MSTTAENMLQRALARRAEVDAKITSARGSLASSPTSVGKLDLEIGELKKERDRLDFRIAAARQAITADMPSPVVGAVSGLPVRSRADETEPVATTKEGREAMTP